MRGPITVASAGKNNPFNHPHDETVERYKNSGALFYSTDRDGAVTITSEDNAYEVKTYWDSTFKEAHCLGDEIKNLRLLF